MPIASEWAGVFLSRLQTRGQTFIDCQKWALVLTQDPQDHVGILEFLSYELHLAMQQGQWAEALLNQYGRSLVRYAASIIRDQNAAIEVVQNVFGEIQQLSYSDIEGLIPGYLYRECRSQALEVLNRRKSSGKTDGVEPVPNWDDITLSGSDDDRYIRKMYNEIGRLSPRQQETLRLKFSDGLSFHEIANIIGASPHIVSVTIAEAVHRLRDAMKAQTEPAVAPKPAAKAVGKVVGKVAAKGKNGAGR